LSAETTSSKPRARVFSPKWVLVYSFLAFLLTWATGITVVLSNQSLLVNGPPEPQIFTLPFPLALSLILIGDYGPALAAILVTFVTARGTGVRVLLRQLLRWRHNPIWYALALFLPLIISLVVLVFFVLVSRSQIPGHCSLCRPSSESGTDLWSTRRRIGLAWICTADASEKVQLSHIELGSGGMWFVWHQ
jgi:hypothetical protein